MNAAIWLGAAVFTLVAAPAIFSGGTKTLGLHPFWPGATAQLLLARFFYLQYICGSVAIAHLLAEWVYLGRPLSRFTLALLSGMLCLGLAGGLWLQPKLKKLHLVMYSMSENYKPAAVPAEDRIEARRIWNRWHGVSRGAHLLVIAGLVVYFWRVTHPTDNLRFVGASTPQFRR